MALEAPLRSSTGNILSAYSHFHNMASSPPPPQGLHPATVQRLSGSPSLVSPSDIVGPSPVTSNGTETTEIEDEESDEVNQPPHRARQEPQLMMLKTNIPDHIRRSPTEESISVIHAPESFQDWPSTKPTEVQEQQSARSSPRGSNITAFANESEDEKMHRDHATPPPLSTNVRPVRYSLDSSTPQAQNLKDVLSDAGRVRSSSSSSLGQIVEMMETDNESSADADVDDNYQDAAMYGAPRSSGFSSRIANMRKSLREMWTLCNTLAYMSSDQRPRSVNSGTPDAHERPWRACWELCQRLYDSKDKENESLAMQWMILDLCRDFCNALYDVRQRTDEDSDSLLRVAFEMGNHFYSGQKQDLPDPFNERSLDFYITMCHRLMRQREKLPVPDGTDSLLRACWSVAEMLFSLRQNKRNGLQADEMLLGSAVQAIWDLGDVFREGCPSIQPDRHTPRASQMSFFGHQVDQSGRESRASNRSSRSRREQKAPERRARPIVPETPVTEFEDTPVTPDCETPAAPNIMVLGTVSDSSRVSSRGGGRWSSNASSLSSYSHGSARTSSTATAKTKTVEDGNVTLVKILVLRAAITVGFQRDTVPEGRPGMVSLQSFVRNLPLEKFGTFPSQTSLLQNYKNLVLSDSVLPRLSTLPARGSHGTATEIALAVHYMMHRWNQYDVLRELFKLVFGFTVDEAEANKNKSIHV